MTTIYSPSAHLFGLGRAWQLARVPHSADEANGIGHLLTSLNQITDDARSSGEKNEITLFQLHLFLSTAVSYPLRWLDLCR